MDPVVTRPRTLALIASVCWLIAAFPLGPTIGRLLMVPRIAVPVLGTWVLLVSLSLAVLIVEILRSVMSRWSTWTNRRHFLVVVAVAAGMAVLQILIFVYGLGRGYA